MLSALTLISVLPFIASVARAGTVGVDPNHLPHTNEPGQSGYNDCGTVDSPSAKCQNIWLKSIEDFCFFAPAVVTTVGDAERDTVAYCTAKGHGSRLVPAGTLKGAHYVVTDKYIQITAVGDFTKVDLSRHDEGGELDPHVSYDGYGNPIGGLVFGTVGGKVVQITEWNQFIAYNELSIRACWGPDATKYCPHIYDEQGSEWNEPGNYGTGFDSCQGQSEKYPPGLYSAPGGKTSTFYQGQAQTPAAHPPIKTSSCRKVSTIAGASYGSSSPAPKPNKNTKVTKVVSSKKASKKVKKTAH